MSHICQRLRRIESNDDGETSSSVVDKHRKISIASQLPGTEWQSIDKRIITCRRLKDVLSIPGQYICRNPPQQKTVLDGLVNFLSKSYLQSNHVRLKSKNRATDMPRCFPRLFLRTKSLLPGTHPAMMGDGKNISYLAVFCYWQNNICTYILLCAARISHHQVA